MKIFSILWMMLVFQFAMANEVELPEVTSDTEDETFGSEPFFVDPNLRYYVVELVVFRNLDTYSQEIFQRRDTFGDAPAAYEFLEGDVVSEEQELSVYGEFQRAPEDYMQLSSAVQKLEQSSLYRPMLHVGWIQPGFDRDQVQAEPLQAVGEVEQLSGTATLTVSNHLHLDMDLILESEDLTLYELREKRKMRRNETHYFDHPHLGVLAIVTRLEDFEPAEEENPALTSN